MAMSFTSANPATGECLGTFDEWTDGQVDQALALAHRASGDWAETPVADRCDAVRAVGRVLIERSDSLAEIISLEMGKLIVEARAEIKK